MSWQLSSLRSCPLNHLLVIWGSVERLGHSQARVHQNSGRPILCLLVELLHFLLSIEILRACYAFIPAPGQVEHLQLLVEVSQVSFFVHVLPPYLPKKRDTWVLQLLDPSTVTVYTPCPYLGKSHSPLQIGLPTARPAHLLCRQSTGHSHLAHPVFCNQHPLRTPKASEGCVGGQIGLTNPPSAPNVGDLIGVVHVEKSSFHYLGQRK